MDAGAPGEVSPGGEAGGAVPSHEYTEPTTTPPDPPGSGRRGWLVVVSAVAVVAALAVGVPVALAAARPHLVAVRPHAARTLGPGQLPRGNLAELADRPSQATASDGGGLRVVDQGFTQLHESSDSSGHPGPYTPVRAGIIVENTSRTEVAIQPSVVVRYLDLAGRPVTVDGWKTPDVNFSATAIFPGERVGIAANVDLWNTAISRVTADPVHVYWIPSARLNGYAARLTATDVTVIRTGTPNATIISFPVHNRYPRTLTVYGDVIFRNSAGAVVGSSDQAERQYAPPGDATASCIGWLPADLDTSRIEVYLTLLDIAT